MGGEVWLHLVRAGDNGSLSTKAERFWGANL
jgi:hypothetical protein